MEQQNNKTEEEKFLENSGLELAQEKATITPTMIDDSVDEQERKRDLSAIIPIYESKEDLTGENLISREETLKSDGSEVLATIDDLGDVIFKANYQLPNQIDIKGRKEQYIREKSRKKKKEKRKLSKAAKKQQNIISFASLLVIGFLVAFYFLYIKAPGEEDFVPQTVKVELGDKLPIRTEKYVKPGVGTKVDELLYKKDTSKVIVEEVGEYDFTITYKKIVKHGKVIIQDTTPPKLETRVVSIIEGDEYNASSFVESCYDYSGCNYSFQDTETQKKYTTVGVYNVYIIATDAYGNSVNKKASLLIEPKGLEKVYTKKTSYDFKTGYSKIDEYQLNFADYSTYSLLYKGKHTITYIYEDEEKYQQAKKEHFGEFNYTSIDHEKKIILTESVNVIGSNYSKLDDIEGYLAKEGYKLK